MKTILKIFLIAMMGLFVVSSGLISCASENDGKEGGKSKAQLKVGDEAPLFELKNHAGETVALKDFRGKKVVLLAFYPKDDSPGCTAEMKDFRDDFAEFEKAGVQILGISVDGQKSHIDFKKKFDLQLPLLSDEKTDVSKAYGVYNKIMNVSERSYFLVDKKGVIRYIQIEKFMKYNPRKEELLKVVQDIMKKEKEAEDKEKSPE